MSVLLRTRPGRAGWGVSVATHGAHDLWYRMEAAARVALLLAEDPSGPSLSHQQLAHEEVSEEVWEQGNLAPTPI